jgi:hypothetical protein
MCIGMQESTGDLLGIPTHSRKDSCKYLLQAFCLTLTRTVRLYTIHIRDPIWYRQADITDPGTSVMLWDGMEMVPHIRCVHGRVFQSWGLNIKAYRRRPNLGHAMLAWYAGPSASLDNKDTKNNLLITCTESWLGCGWILKWRRYVQIDAEKTSG